MNLFYLHHDPRLCAQAHCDKHVVKMIIEYAQLLSTAHRLLDGVESVILQNGRRKKVWTLPDEGPSYVASHVSHPDAIWVRESKGNYSYLARLFFELCSEYGMRYGRSHATFMKLKDHLGKYPKNIPDGPFTPPPLCMPDEYKVEDDAITSYQNLYVGSKARFAKWTDRRPPEWFITRTENYDASNFERARRVDRAAA